MAYMTDETHDPLLQSWVESAQRPGTDFPIQNLPYGTFRTKTDPTPRIGVAIGDFILDLREIFDGDLNALMATPAAERRELRRQISRILSDPALRRDLTAQAEAEMLLPARIGDYTDFYASAHHATNVGSMFRPDNPLLPNYKWLPVAYHGRSSSIVVSGTPFHRPQGQVTEKPDGPPVFAPSRQLDYELELGAFLGLGNAMGERIPIASAEEHIFGVCLLNDWSARDIQRWEYQPLGPFLAKNFATSVSPWIVTLDALAPFRCAPAPRAAGDPSPLPHLAAEGNGAIDLSLEVWLQSARMTEPMLVSRADFAVMYWTLAQMVAHHASNGCPLRPGDLIGSGTVSGPTPESRGCLLERTWRGTEPLQLPTGEQRRFLEDGDQVILKGYCERPGFARIGLGECRGTVLPAVS
jgi:fumarylacetoacetase